MDTTSLIILICVVIPAILAIGICIIIFYSNCDYDRKLDRPRSSSFAYDRSHSIMSHNNYIIDFPRSYGYSQPQHRLREPTPTFEECSPPYENSINYIERQQSPPPPLFSSICTTPIITNLQQSSSSYSTMPPSYAEIFLTPSTLINQ